MQITIAFPIAHTLAESLSIFPLNNLIKTGKNKYTTAVITKSIKNIVPIFKS